MEDMAKIEDTADINMQNIGNRISEMGDRMGSGIGEVGRKMKSELGELPVNEATIPNAFRHAPKFISPKVHAWLDFAVTTYFLGLGAWFAGRRKSGRPRLRSSMPAWSPEFRC